MPRFVCDRYFVATFAAIGALILPAVLHASAAGVTPEGPGAMPADFADQLVAAVAAPTALAFTPDGRLLITTQSGTVRVYEGGSLLTTPALTLAGSICTGSERGLLGIAVDPAFTANHYVYVYYTSLQGGTCLNRVSRFVLPDGNVIDRATETVLIDDIHSTQGNHNAGDVQFGKDGYLYVSVGDGGCDYAAGGGCAGGNDAARDQHVLLGKILRITKNGEIPADNPFTGPGTADCRFTGSTTPGNKCRETFAWGLRNPFRIAFDPNAAATRFFINDVGQSNWEEIDEGLAGADYGWNVREGRCPNGWYEPCAPAPPGMTGPIYDYPHNEPPGGGSITGGAFVPNGVWPSQYDGDYLFGDYVRGTIYRLEPAGASYTRSDFVTGLGGSSAVHMLFGPYGATQALYYTSYAGGGQVRRIAYTAGGNRTPTADVTADPTSGPAPLEVDFDGSGSSDPDAGDTLTYVWDFDDGSPAVETATPTTSHTYQTPGTYDASLRVRDNHGAVSSPDTVRIDPGNTPPVPTITTPGSMQRFAVGEVVTLQGSAVDAQEGPLANTALSWNVVRHHGTDHTHPWLPDTAGNNVPMPPAPGPEDIFTTSTSYLEVRLTATDSTGLAATTVRDFYPRPVALTFQTVPSALELNLFSSPVTAPHTLQAWAGWQFAVSAQRQTDGSGKTWIFDSWSDGGAATHTITTGTTPATYTATFHENRAPVASAGTVNAVEDVPKTLVLQATDADSDPLTYGVSRSPLNGFTGPPSGNQVVYTPASQYNGGDSFGFTATDGDATSAEANVAITVSEVNDPPVATGDSATTSEDTSVLIDVLANDSKGPANEGSQSLTIDAVDDPPHGTAAIEGGKVRFTPENDYSGPDSFGYRICDNGTTGGSADPLCTDGTIGLTIDAVNDPPIAVGDAAKTKRDESVLIDVLANDLPGPANESAQTLSLGTISDPAHGLAVAEAGKIRYTPNAGYEGDDSISYQACDNGSPGLCSNGSAVVTVTEMNRAPTVSPGSHTLPEDTTATLSLAGADPDGDPLSFTIVSGPSNGSIGTPAGSDVVYTPAANYNGPDSFTFKATDGSLDSNVAIFSITVAPVNDPPVPGLDFATTAEDVSLVIDVTANDSPGPANEAGQTVRVNAVGAPAHGTASVIATGPDAGKVRYTPARDYNGPDNFSHQVCDDGTTNGAPDPKCAGSAVAFSFSAFDAPLNTSAPEIAGARLAGGIVRADTGTWTPFVLSTEFQWFRCARDGSRCAPIAGATSASHVLRVADIFHRLRVGVTARNRFGSRSALSDPTPLIRSPVVISRVVFDSPGLREDEWIVLRNIGARTVDLRRWTISDGDGNVYRFGRLALRRGRSVTVESGRRARSAGSPSWGRGGLVWDDGGDQATLRTPNGTRADSCRYRPNRSGAARC